MTEVSFSEEQETTKFASTVKTSKGGLTTLFIRMGIAKTESQANMAMGIIALAAFVAAGMILYTGSSRQTAPSVEMLRQQAWMAQGHTGAAPADFKP